ncbi:MAG: L,D-transpeptidase [Thermoanaerobaculum sp.]|nr:L,D-transpeptidase [Thermoanaerobaculum sp.]
MNDPTTARWLERLLAEAEKVTAHERSVPFWEHLPGRSEAAWLRATRAAAAALREHRARQTAAQANFEALLQKARHEVSRAQQEIAETGMGRREAAALQRAQGALARAAALARLGQWAQAADLTKAALADAAIVHSSFASLHARFSDPTLRRQWKLWVEETLLESRREGKVVIIVDKLRRRLSVYRGGELLATFAAELGANGLRPKQHAGDRATPEGRYHVVQKKQGAATKYYKALLINYPNDQDRIRFRQARSQGRIPWRAGIGSLIEIHGEGGEGRDWTDGCVALRNSDMDRVFAWAEVGTPVTIVGTYDP